MKRLPLITSFVLFIALCVSAAYWAMQMFNPPAARGRGTAADGCSRCPAWMRRRVCWADIQLLSSPAIFN